MKRSPRRNSVVTIADVARATGLSTTSVSDALRDKPSVSVHTRKSVQTAAQQMGYRPSAAARALVGGKTHTIGVFLPQTVACSTTFLRGYSDLITEVGRNLLERNYNFSMVSWGDLGLSQDTQSKDLPRIMQECAIDGALLIQSEQHIEHHLRAHHTPYVVVDEISPSGCSVSVDSHRSAELAVEHLASLGHTRIAALHLQPLRNEPDSSDLQQIHVESSERHVLYTQGYLQAMSRLGLPAMGHYGLVDESQTLTARESLHALFALKPRPTAVIVYDDMSAVALLTWMANLGLKIPDDMSVVTLLDTGMYSDMSLQHPWFIPAFTGIGNTQSVMANRGIELLFGMINTPGRRPASAVLQPELIERESTRPCIEQGKEASP